MSSLLLRRQAVAIPPQRVDPGHPLARGLALYALGGPADLINRARAGPPLRAALTGRPAGDTSPWGAVTRGGAGASYASFGTTADFSPGTDDFTIACLFRFPEGGGTAAHFPLSTRSSASTDGYDILLNNGNVGGRITIRVDPVGFSQMASNDFAGFDDGQFHLVVFSRRAGPSWTIFIDGILRQTMSGGSNVVNTQALSLNRRGTTYSDVPVALTAYWSRALDDADVRSLTRDPLALLTPSFDFRAMLRGPRAAGSASLSAADGQHSQLADPAALTAISLLGAGEASHLHTGDAASLSVAGSLAAAAARHGHSSDAASLATATALAANRATHAHTGDTASLSTGGATLLRGRIIQPQADGATLIGPDARRGDIPLS